MNQPWVYMCPTIMNHPPTSFPTSLWIVPEHQLWVPCFMHRTYTDLRLGWRTMDSNILEPHLTLEQRFSSCHMHTHPLCISLKCRCQQVVGWGRLWLRNLYSDLFPGEAKAVKGSPDGPARISLWVMSFLPISSSPFASPPSFKEIQFSKCRKGFFFLDFYL